MYCQSCGEEVGESAEFCPACGEPIGPEPETEGQETGDSDRWEPHRPVLSVFVSLVLLWAAVVWALYTHGRVSDFVILAVPGVLAMPWVRQRAVSWVRERFGVNLASERVIGLVDVVYAVFLLMAIPLIFPVVRSPGSALMVIAAMFIFAYFFVSVYRSMRGP